MLRGKKKIERRGLSEKYKLISIADTQEVHESSGRNKDGKKETLFKDS